MATYSPPHLLDGARWKNLRVGLVGGSFNPPHEGHLHLSRTALHMLKLDYIWWLVTPQNPHKSSRDLAPFDKRIKLCQTITKYEPQILVSDLEQQTGTTRSYDTLHALHSAFPLTDFLWITGMDNALTFHRWHKWQDILKLVATAHVARPPAESMAVGCPLRQMSSQTHICPDSAVKADLTPGHTYWLTKVPMLDISSTRIRKSS